MSPLSRCDYCGRSQEFDQYNGGCVSCGAALPKPQTRVVEREYRISRHMIDVTSFTDEYSVFKPGVRDVLLREKVLEP